MSDRDSHVSNYTEHGNVLTPGPWARRTCHARSKPLPTQYDGRQSLHQMTTLPRQVPPLTIFLPNLNVLWRQTHAVA